MAEKQQTKPCGVNLDREQFSCSVCLDLLKEPVTLHCGHSYCQSCIEGSWDREKEQGQYSCPQCRETFDPRPVLRRNNILAEVVAKLERMSTMQVSTSGAEACLSPSDIACDFCSRTEPNKATMSCLTCLASYCPTHLEPHYSVAVLETHQLVSTTIPLQEKICRKHNKLMEVYCQTDQQLVCSLCVIDEHEDHKMMSVLEKKTQTENLLVLSQKQVREKFKQREKELKELNHTEVVVKSHRPVQENNESADVEQPSSPVVMKTRRWVHAQSALMDCDQIFVTLISSLEKRRSEVKRLITAQEQTAVAQAEEIRLQLMKEITKLRTRSAELKQLSHVDDHIHFIQSFRSLSTSCEPPGVSPWSDPLRSFRDVTDCVSELKDQLEKVLKETWPRISATVSYVDFSLPPTPNTREEFLRYCCPLTLDVNSSYPHLQLIDDDLRVRPWLSPYSPHPDRFTKFPQVVCRQGLSERRYWEVEGHGRTLSAAVAYKDTDRTSSNSSFGSDDKSWSLERTAIGYLFRHNNVETVVSGPRSGKIGVYLDYKAGTLCFYDVSDLMVLLHKVHTTFTKPLYPGIGLNYEWYDVGVFAQLVKLW